MKIPGTFDGPYHLDDLLPGITAPGNCGSQVPSSSAQPVAAKDVMDAPIASSAAVDNTATNFVCFFIMNALSFDF